MDTCDPAPVCPVPILTAPHGCFCPQSVASARHREPPQSSYLAPVHSHSATRARKRCRKAHSSLCPAPEQAQCLAARSNNGSRDTLAWRALTPDERPLLGSASPEPTCSVPGDRQQLPIVIASVGAARQDAPAPCAGSATPTDIGTTSSMVDLLIGSLSSREDTRSGRT